jgi:hypothetical protein
MTKKELLDQLKDYPDNTRIYLQDFEQKENSFVATAFPVDVIYEKQIKATGERIVVLADGF